MSYSSSNNENIQKNLLIFQEFLQWYNNGDYEEIHKWKVWIQNMMWSRQGENDVTWFEEYDVFIEENHLQDIFYKSYFSDALKVINKRKLRTSRNIHIGTVLSIKHKTVGLFKRKLK